MWKLDYSVPLLILMEQSTNLGIPAGRRRTCWLLKEQYPVSAHAPNFDFWTGCREIKRCEESKRTLKNSFASRLAGSNTTLKHLRITDQWYIVPVKFLFGQKLYFLAFFLLPLAGGPKDWKHFDADWRLISSGSFHTSSDNCERNTEKRKKQMTLARAHNRDTVPLTVSVILDLNSGHYQGQIKPVVRVGLGLEASGL